VERNGGDSYLRALLARLHLWRGERQRRYWAMRTTDSGVWRVAVWHRRYLRRRVNLSLSGISCSLKATSWRAGLDGNPSHPLCLDVSLPRTTGTASVAPFRLPCVRTLAWPSPRLPAEGGDCTARLCSPANPASLTLTWTTGSRCCLLCLRQAERCLRLPLTAPGAGAAAELPYLLLKRSMRRVAATLLSATTPLFCAAAVARQPASRALFRTCCASARATKAAFALCCSCWRACGAAYLCVTCLRYSAPAAGTEKYAGRIIYRRHKNA